MNSGLVSISLDSRPPLTEDEKILAIITLTDEVTGQLSELRNIHDAFTVLLEEVSKVKNENNLQLFGYTSEVRQSMATLASELSEIRLHQQRTFWRRIKAWITRG